MAATAARDIKSIFFKDSFQGLADHILGGHESKENKAFMDHCVV